MIRLRNINTNEIKSVGEWLLAESESSGCSDCYDFSTCLVDFAEFVVELAARGPGAEDIYIGPGGMHDEAFNVVDPVEKFLEEIGI